MDCFLLGAGERNRKERSDGTAMLRSQSRHLRPTASRAVENGERHEPKRVLRMCYNKLHLRQGRATDKQA